MIVVCGFQPLLQTELSKMMGDVKNLADGLTRLRVSPEERIAYPISSPFSIRPSRHIQMLSRHLLGEK